MDGEPSGAAETKHGLRSRLERFLEAVHIRRQRKDLEELREIMQSLH